MKALVFWSTGKDSALALHAVKVLGFEVVGLIVTVDSSSNVVTGHRVPVGLARLQAERLNIPLYEVELPEDFPPLDVYENIMLRELQSIKRETGAGIVAHGDIHVRDMMEYKRRLLDRIGMKSIYPLEGLSSADTIKAVEALGIEALIVAVDIVKLGPIIASQLACSTLNWGVLRRLPATTDIAGERGEYHTLVTKMPGFREPLKVKVVELKLESWRLGWKLVCKVEPA